MRILREKDPDFALAEGKIGRRLVIVKHNVLFGVHRPARSRATQTVLPTETLTARKHDLYIDIAVVYLQRRIRRFFEIPFTDHQVSVVTVDRIPAFGQTGKMRLLQIGAYLRKMAVQRIVGRQVG